MSPVADIHAACENPPRTSRRGAPIEVRGYYNAWLSRLPVKPTNVIELRQPLLEIARRGVELRVLLDLWELRDRVVASTVGFSIIRLREAASDGAPIAP